MPRQRKLSPDQELFTREADAKELEKRGAVSLDRVRFGLIGLGNIGIHHYSYFHELEGAELTAVCDVDETKFARLDAPVAQFKDYRKMLDSGKIDAVIIGAPHVFHPEMAKAAFARGIHVILEKPVAITSREARMINAAHEGSDVVFAAMFQMRTEPVYNKIKELLKDGTLGEIRRVSWIITNWFRTQSYYDSGGWRGNWTGEGGGVLMNQCPHNLDLFQWFFGLPRQLTSLAYLGKWHDITVEDDVSVLMELANGATASFVTTTADTPGTNRLDIAAENGKLVLESGVLTFYKTAEPVQTILNTSQEGFYSENPEVIEIPVDAKPHGHRYITQNFINVILGKEELIAPGTEGLKSVQLANAMLLSGLKGRRVDLPVSEDEFDELLEELRQDERQNAPDKVFDWDAYLRGLGVVD
ncbi:MAG: Gfo/Idh/MocA family oxidoreductase [Firmicutes bacterium]|nr:Gfo/Idh/MocA family oxidoreductase [Bacillota bacterium]